MSGRARAESDELDWTEQAMGKRSEGRKGESKAQGEGRIRGQIQEM